MSQQENNKAKKRLTVKDIANICGVSTATVSRVLNGSDAVSPKLKEKVQHAIEQYNFVPNQLAKNFSANTSNSIAIFVYDITNPFFTKLLEELNRIAFDNNYSLIICNTKNSEERESRYVKFVQSINVSGLILTEGACIDSVGVVGKNIPVVTIDRCLKNKFDFPLVTSNNHQGALQAVEHLIKLNHKKIAFVGGPEKFRTAEIRKQGYLEAMSKHGLPVKDGYIFGSDFKFSGGIAALEHFISLEEPPSAIFFANDLMAQGFALRANSLNLSIPKDFSLVGFDGVSPETFYPRLTTIQQQVDEIAGAVMQLMFTVAEKRFCSEKEIVIPTRLVVGDTSQKI